MRAIRLVRSALSGVMVCALCACQTSPPVRDMSTLTAKFAAQMDDAVKSYVAALNENNSSDSARLRNEQADAVRLAAATADSAAVWHLMSGARAANVSRTLTAVDAMSATEASPVSGAAPQSSAASLPPPPKIVFDDTPLKTIGTVAGSIAQPRSFSEQLSVLAAYAQTVQSDLKSAGK